MESILVPGENGKFFKLTFNSDGLVTEMSDNSGSIRLHKPGFTIYGYDFKLPGQGTAEYEPILTTTSDARGNILSGTANRTGQTWTVPVPGTVATVNPSNGGVLGTYQNLGNSYSTTAKQRLASCISACDAIRNDASRANKKERDRCHASVEAAFQNCMASVLGHAATGGLVGGGVGVVFGGGIGAGVGFVGGWVLVGGAKIFECHSNLSTNWNLCNRNYDIERADLISDHKSCTSRCYTQYKNETSPR
jgi:hypothetical protein